MVKKAALKTASISMAGFQPRPKVFDGQTPLSVSEGATALHVREPGKPYTGVGSVMAAITREAEMAHELAGTQAQLVHARQQLAAYDGAALVRALDPRLVRRSRWANRVEAEFASPEFRQLKDEIAQAGGNVQPIKVRTIGPPADRPGRVFDGQTPRPNGLPQTPPAQVFDGQTPVEQAVAAAPASRVFDGQTPRLQAPGEQQTDRVFDGQTPLYEIVYGHRRHQACLELGLPVQAVVVSGMDDRSLFEAMERENRGRKNLSAWEQGRMYDEALRQGLYASLRRLSDSLGVNLSDAARAVQLARLPAEVVAAFASPLDLQVRWAKPLADALQRDPEGVLARARALARAPRLTTQAQVQPALAGAEVVARLLAAPARPQPLEAAIKSGKRTLAVLRLDAQGRASIDIPAGVLAPGRHEALARLLKTFLAEQPDS